MCPASITLVSYVNFDNNPARRVWHNLQTGDSEWPAAQYLLREEMGGWLRNGGDEPLLQVCIQLTNCHITTQAAAIPRHSTFRLP